MKEITLSSGMVVRIAPVPPYSVIAAQAVVALPELPINRGMAKTADGREEPFAIPITDTDNPAYQQYLRELSEAQKKRSSLANEITLLMGLPDVQAPDSDEWFAPLAYLGVKPRMGAQGKKLDYIQYLLMASDHDLTAVFDAINEVTYVKEERIQSVESSFPGNGQFAAARQPVSASAAAEPA